MHTECDTSLQLSFDFEATSTVQAPPRVSQNNVVHVKFGEKTGPNSNKSVEDLAVLERVLLNARKLKW